MTVYSSFTMKWGEVLAVVLYSQVLVEGDVCCGEPPHEVFPALRPPKRPVVDVHVLSELILAGETPSTVTPECGGDASNAPPDSLVSPLDSF
ncbi:hypothetical protein CHU98_g75 [Xylaria longipes]|nr:hypothetical protein CHU98_g75 [Xylaria longipes]